MPRAAIYARYSTDLQSERSVDDQIALCRAYAERNGYEVAKSYADAAKSGASMHNRDGIRELMADALEGRFEAVIVEELDRLSRDMEDLAGMFKRLQHFGIEMIGVHGGKADTITVGLRGLVGQLSREDNAKKVKRGMEGLIARGLSAGGRAYGYRPDPMNKGKLIIVDDEAEVIRRIFAECAEGVSPRKVAEGLNKDRIAPPRGERWNASTINGSAKRANGILHNSLYVGVLIWGRGRMVKDPDTGRRLNRPVPESEWKRADVPELRIVTDELWTIAQEHRRESVVTPAEAQTMRRPKNLLSGILKCGACGSGMSSKGIEKKTGRVRIRCTRAHESGDCPNPKEHYLDAVETLVVGSLVAKLRSPDNLKTYIAAYQEERQRLIGDKVAKRSRLERDRAIVEREWSAIMKLAREGLIEDAELAKELPAIRERRKAIEAELAVQPEAEKVVSFLPAAMERYERAMRDLHAAFRSGGVAGVADRAGFIREILTSATVFPNAEGADIEVEVKGYLNGILTTVSPDEPRNKFVGGIDGSGGGI